MDTPTQNVTFSQSEARFQLAWAVNAEQADRFSDRFILEERETDLGVVEMITEPLPIRRASQFAPQSDFLCGEPNMALLANPEEPMSLNDLRPAYPSYMEDEVENPRYVVTAA